MKNQRLQRNTPELADRICELVATTTHGLKTLCKMYDELPAQPTILEWRQKYDDFSSNYAKDKMRQAETMVASLEDVADAARTYTE